MRTLQYTAILLLLTIHGAGYAQDEKPSPIQAEEKHNERNRILERRISVHLDDVCLLDAVNSVANMLGVILENPEGVTWQSSKRISLHGNSLRVPLVLDAIAGAFDCNLQASDNAIQISRPRDFHGSGLCMYAFSDDYCHIETEAIRFLASVMHDQIDVMGIATKEDESKVDGFGISGSGEVHRSLHMILDGIREGASSMARITNNMRILDSTLSVEFTGTYIELIDYVNTKWNTSFIKHTCDIAGIRHRVGSQLNANGSFSISGEMSLRELLDRVSGIYEIQWTNRGSDGIQIGKVKTNDKYIEVYNVNGLSIQQKWDIMQTIRGAQMDYYISGDMIALYARFVQHAQVQELMGMVPIKQAEF